MEPKYTPDEMIRRLDQAITKLLTDPEMKQHATSLYSHRTALTQPDALQFPAQLLRYLEDRRRTPEENE